MTFKEAIEYIKAHIGIVDLVQRYVDLKPNGPRWSAPCPFHQETRASFFVSPDKGFFHCFGCQASGDIFDFYTRIHGLEFGDAIKQMADELGINIEYDKKTSAGAGETIKNRTQKNLIMAMYALAARFYQSCLAKDEAKLCREYIKKRGLSDEIQKFFQLGYAPASWHALTGILQKGGFDSNIAQEAGLIGQAANGNKFDKFRDRLIFPIKNLSGQVIAFGGRIIRDCEEAKYINSSDSPIYKKGEHLFGLYQARRAISSKGHVFLTEGYMDVLTLHQFGYPNSVGVLGTALTSDQIKRLSGFTSRIILLFDGDNAGRKAAFRSCELLLSRGFSCDVVLMPESEDIDSLLRTKGADYFDTLLSNAVGGFNYCIDVLSRMAPKEAIAWANNFTAHICVPELASHYLSKLAMHLGLSEEELRNSHFLNTTKKQSFSREILDNSDNSTNQFASMREEQILIVSVRYPHRIEEIRNFGADLLISSPFAKNFWKKLQKYSEENVACILNDSQKEFWNKYRGPCAPPLHSEEREILSLKKLLEDQFSANQKSLLSTSIGHQNGLANFEQDLEFLRMLQQTLENNDE